MGKFKKKEESYVSRTLGLGGWGRRLFFFFSFFSFFVLRGGGRRRRVFFPSKKGGEGFFWFVRGATSKGLADRGLIKQFYVNYVCMYHM